MTKAMDLSNAFGMLYNEEVKLLNEIAGKSKNPYIINVGVGFGTSSLAFIEGANFECTIISVDMSDGGPLGGMQNEINAFTNAGYIEHLPHQIIGDSQKKATATKVAKLLPASKKADIIFIDADHSAEGLTKDIDNWLPFLKKGGYVIYHDYNRDFWPEVKRVIDEWVEENKEEYEFIALEKTAICFKKVK